MKTNPLCFESLDRLRDLAARKTARRRTAFLLGVLLVLVVLLVWWPVFFP